MRTQPENWPIGAPEYHSKEGWELEKKMALETIKEQLKKPRITYSCLVHMRTSALWAAEQWWALGIHSEAIRYYKIMNRIEKAMWNFPAVNSFVS